MILHNEIRRFGIRRNGTEPIIQIICEQGAMSTPGCWKLHAKEAGNVAEGINLTIPSL